MTEPQDRDTPFRKIEPVSPTTAIAHVFAEAESSGLPFTYVSVHHTSIDLGATTGPLERLLVDLESSDAAGEYEKTTVAKCLDGSRSVRTASVTRFRRAFVDADSVMSFLKMQKLDSLCERQHWYASTKLLTGDWNYWLDPGNPWPLWSSVLGCDREVSADGPPGGRGGPPLLPNELLTEGRLSSGTVAMLPFVAARLKQDLIRLEHGRLRQVADRTEQATIAFVLGTLGWNFVLSNRAELHFKLLGEHRNVVHSGTVALREDELKYGVTLSVPEGLEDRRIFSTDLELLLNGVVVDRSLAVFIRSIKISLSMKGG